MKYIEKKILPEYYDPVIKGIKTCELRKDDSDYCVGDVLILREWNGTKYTGRSVSVKITYILRNLPELGLKDGYAIICFKRYKMNVYICRCEYDRGSLDGYYVAAETPAEAKQYYAYEMDCEYIDVRYTTVRKNVKCGAGWLDDEEAERLGLEFAEE